MNQLLRISAVLSSLVCLACSSSIQQPKPEQAQASVADEFVADPVAETVTVVEEEVPAFERDTTPLFDDAESLTIAKPTWVLATPFVDGARLGLIAAKTRVIEKAHVENEDCPTPWVEIEPRGWVCVGLKPSQKPPTSLAASKPMRNMPGAYAIASRSARFYKSVEAAQNDEEGRAAKGDMVKRRGTVQLEDGRVLWRTDRGEYVDPTTLRRSSGSRFQGVDLTDEHGPMLPFGFALRADDPKKTVPVLSEPSHEASVVERLARRAVVEILATSEDGNFVRIGEDQWLQKVDLRVVEKRQPPAEVEEGARWIDVDLEQQLVVAYEGTEAVFATLASTGKGVNATPTGVFNITRKKRRTTMRNDRSKKQEYSVAVPWPVYFNKGFAFHSAYWHNGFGSPRSHGCVNLSPSDAARIYRFVGPEMPAGWTVVFDHESQPGTTIHVRSADELGPRIASK